MGGDEHRLPVHPPHPRLAARDERLEGPQHQAAREVRALQLHEAAHHGGQLLPVRQLRHVTRLVPLVLAGLHEVLHDAGTRAQGCGEPGQLVGGGRRILRSHGAPHTARREPVELLVPAREFMRPPVARGAGEQGAAPVAERRLQLRVPGGGDHPAPVPVRSGVPRDPGRRPGRVPREQRVMIEQRDPPAALHAPRRPRRRTADRAGRAATGRRRTGIRSARS